MMPIQLTSIGITCVAKFIFACLNKRTTWTSATNPKITDATRKPVRCEFMPAFSHADLRFVSKNTARESSLLVRRSLGGGGLGRCPSTERRHLHNNSNCGKPHEQQRRAGRRQDDGMAD